MTVQGSTRASTTPRTLGFGARLRKLRAMSAAELAHRVRGRVVEVVDRLEQRRRSERRSPLKEALRADLRRRADWADALLEEARQRPGRFFAGVTDAAAELFSTRFAAEAARARERSGELRERTIRFFGETFQFENQIPWHRDPVSGREWPRIFHADVPIHGGDVGYGDPKYVWELNRHQFLIDLGKVYFLDRQAEDAALVRAMVLDWIDENPVGVGVNWASPLEPAFRMLSWLWAYRFCLDDPTLDPAAHARWIAGFADHGTFLERHLELFSSPYNHLIGEATALYLAGLLLPQLAAAPRWQRLGRAILHDRVPQQFYPDGGCREQATFYHHATLGFYLQAALIGRANGDELAPEIWSAMERAIDFSTALTQPDGLTPRIGDADDGKSIRVEEKPLWDFRAFQALGAVLFRRPDFKHVAGRFHEDAFWLLGVDGLTAFDQLPAQPPSYTSRAFEHSGYWVLRSDWSARADYVCFDCGEQCDGARPDGVPNALHGHADCLSVVAYLGGRPALLDPGFFTYNTPPAWEDHFRKTIAHNTVRVDGTDQSRHIVKMAWSDCYRAEPHGSGEDGESSWVSGSHDGYRRGLSPVGHSRLVWLRPAGLLVILDTLDASGEHAFDITYQLPPGDVPFEWEENLTAGDVWVEWQATTRLTATIAHGGPDPADGWVAPGLGVREAAPRLNLTGSLRAGRTTILTLIGDARRVRPLSRHDQRRLVAGRPEGVLRFGVSTADYTEWLLCEEAGSGPAGRQVLSAWRELPDRVTRAGITSTGSGRAAAPAGGAVQS